MFVFNDGKIKWSLANFYAEILLLTVGSEYSINKIRKRCKAHYNNKQICAYKIHCVNMVFILMDGKELKLNISNVAKVILQTHTHPTIKID